MILWPPTTPFHTPGDVTWPRKHGRECGPAARAAATGPRVNAEGFLWETRARSNGKPAGKSCRNLRVGASAPGPFATSGRRSSLSRSRYQSLGRCCRSCDCRAELTAALAPTAFAGGGDGGSQETWRQLKHEEMGRECSCETLARAVCSLLRRMISRPAVIGNRRLWSRRSELHEIVAWSARRRVWWRWLQGVLSIGT